MIPQLIKLRGDVNELEERVYRLEMKIDMLATQMEHLILTTTMAHAHVENLIERVYVLEGNEVPCTCGYGGQHEPANPRCQRNQHREMVAGGEVEGE